MPSASRPAGPSRPNPRKGSGARQKPTPSPTPKPARAPVPVPVVVPDATPRPHAVLVVVAATLLEVAALAVGFVVAVVEAVRGGSDGVGASLALALVALALGAVLALSARAVLAGARWGRSPIATWQLLQGLVAFSWWQGSHSGWALVVVAFSLVVFVLLMLPAVVRFTSRSTRPADPAS